MAVFCVRCACAVCNSACVGAFPIVNINKFSHQDIWIWISILNYYYYVYMQMCSPLHMPWLQASFVGAPFRSVSIWMLKNCRWCNPFQSVWLAGASLLRDIMIHTHMPSISEWNLFSDARRCNFAYTTICLAKFPIVCSIHVNVCYRPHNHVSCSLHGLDGVVVVVVVFFSCSQQIIECIATPLSLSRNAKITTISVIIANPLGGNGAGLL